MPMAWHYTTLDKFKLIVAEGLIRPATVGVEPPEMPIVWFSLAEFFEPTARKGVRDPVSKRLLTLSVQGTRRLGNGLVRFGVDSSTLIPWKWGRLRKQAQMRASIAKSLEKVAVREGANSLEWFGSLEPVNINLCRIEVMDDNEMWVSIYTPDG